MGSSGIEVKDSLPEEDEEGEDGGETKEGEDFAARRLSVHNPYDEDWYDAAEDADGADDADGGIGQPEQVNIVLVCRVILGNPMMADAQLSGRRPINTKEFDSVVANSILVGDKMKHREFVVYDRHQIYPEFVVTYQC